jgi:hypothetical protein
MTLNAEFEICRLTIILSSSGHTNGRGRGNDLVQTFKKWLQLLAVGLITEHTFVGIYSTLITLVIQQLLLIIRSPFSRLEESNSVNLTSTNFLISILFVSGNGRRLRSLRLEKRCDFGFTPRIHG